MRGLRIVLMLCVMVMTLAGCQSKGGPRLATTMAAAYVPAPASVRIYPTTRFVEDAGRVFVEMRIELLDDMDDPIKSAGHFHLELLTAPKASDAPTGLRLYAWDLSLVTREDQSRHFDRITRCYVFRLATDEATAPKQDRTLKVVFSPITGQRLEARGTIAGRPVMQ